MLAASAFYHSLESSLITGKITNMSLQPASSIDVVALQGSLIIIMDTINVGVTYPPIGNCTISNGGTLLMTLSDAINYIPFGLVIQLPHEDTCSIIIS